MNIEDYATIHTSASLILISEDLRAAADVVADRLIVGDVDIEMASLLVGCSLVEVQAVLRELGDVEGHEFHGNQWTNNQVVQSILSSGVGSDHVHSLYSYDPNDAIASAFHLNTVTDKDIDIARAAIARMSQDALRKEFGDTITVYRGKTGTEGKTSTISLTLNKSTAKFHARGKEIKEFQVPIHDVLSYSDAIGRGTFDEKEIVIHTGKLRDLEHSYASTQVNLPEPFRSDVLALAALIDDADLAGDGRETNPHVTLRWGLHGSDPEGVMNLLRGVWPIRVTLGEVSVFEAQPDAEDPIDVVKLTVSSPDLVYLNGLLAQYLPHTQTHDTYSPHVTLAYVKPGMGAKYAGDMTLAGRSFTVNEVQFSNQDDEVTDIPLESMVRAAGDVEGHEFHGNQWTSGSGASASFDVPSNFKLKDAQYDVNTKLPLDTMVVASVDLGLLSSEYGNDARVREMASAIKQGAKLPALTLEQKSNGKLGILDGRTRVAALREAGITGKVPAVIRLEDKGTESALPHGVVIDDKRTASLRAASMRTALRAETLVHQAADVHASGIASDFSKAFKAGLNRVSRTTLSAALAKTKSAAVIVKLLEPVVQATAGVLRLRLEDRLLKAVTSGGEAAAKELTKQMRAAGDLRTLAPRMTLAWDPNHQSAKQWAKAHAAELITDISQTTRDYIRDEVERSFEEGTPITDVVDAIESVVNDKGRAEMIASTESMMAANEGQRQLWDQAIDSGLMSGNEKREWIATGDDGVCPDCEALDGTIVGVDEEYPDDGGDGPPLHPNCRCTEGIVFGNEVD